jgi:hypothetical protein
MQQLRGLLPTFVLAGFGFALSYGLLDGFQAAIVVSVIAAGLGAIVAAVRRRPQEVPEAAVVEDAEPLEEAA